MLVSRRGFFLKLLEWIVFVFIASNFKVRNVISNPASKPLEKKKELSRVVTVFNKSASDGSKGRDNINLKADIVKQMLVNGILAFTGKGNLKDAWADIIPDPSKKVAIKVNCQIEGIYTKEKIVRPIVDGLILRGVSPDNIFIYDKTGNAYEYAGFEKNTGNGVKVGLVSDFGDYSRYLFDKLANLLTGGYDNSTYNFIEKLSKKEDSAFFNFIANSMLKGKEKNFDCQYLINVPVLKALDGYSGVSLSMKNHYGSFAHPYEHHEDIMDYLPYLNNLPEIRNKTRLIVLDAVFAEYKWENGRGQKHIEATNKIMISDDTVAIDFLGWKIIEELRSKHGIEPVTPEPVFIANAKKLGLGNNDPEKIDHISLT